jgi:NAD(P) transhydrogenase subunit alpha
MQVGVPKETWPGEVRCALVPANASKLIKLGFTISMETGAGAESGFSDELFTDAGVTIGKREDVIAGADLLICVRKPDAGEVSMLKSGAITISFLDPYNEKTLVETLAAQGATAISMEMVPRSTRAQKNGCFVLTS